MAAEVLCLSNLRGVGLSMRMYAEDYDGRIPIAPKYSIYWINRWFDWSTFVPAYIESPSGQEDSLLKCPAEPEKHGGYSGITYMMPAIAMGQKLDEDRSYGYGHKGELSKMLILLDSKPSFPALLLGMGGAGYGTPELQIKVGLRHREGANGLFQDLHVEWIGHPVYPSFGPDYYWE
jgi:prepilin-type processing-associated H-X9-DG protein